MKYFLILLLILSFTSVGSAQNQCEFLFQEKLWGQKFYHAYKPSKEPITVGIEVEAMVPVKIGLSGIVNILMSEVKQRYGEVYLQHRPGGSIDYTLNYFKNGIKYTFQVHHGLYAAKEHFIDAEISSPIIRDKEDLDFFLNIVYLLKKKAKFKPQPSQAGIHVHYGFTKTSPAELGFLMTLFSSLEKQIIQSFSTTPNRRDVYVNSTSDSLLYYLDKTPVSQMSVNGLQSVVSEKSYALNILSLQKYQTVEMRLFNSSVNPTHIRQMVNFTVEFMNAVRRKDSRLTDYLVRNRNSEQLDLIELAQALNLPILNLSEKRALRAIKFQSIKSQVEDWFSRDD